MTSHKTHARRLMLAAVGTGAVLLGTSAPVSAQPPPPNCTAADLAGVMSGITAATSAYLFTHPPVNEFFTTLKDVPAEEKRATLQTYMDANPQVQPDLPGIRQPPVPLPNRRGRCPAPFPPMRPCCTHPVPPGSPSRPPPPLGLPPPVRSLRAARPPPHPR